MTAIVKTKQTKTERKTKLSNLYYFETILISTLGVTTNRMFVCLMVIQCFPFCLKWKKSMIRTPHRTHAIVLAFHTFYVLKHVLFG